MTPWRSSQAAHKWVARLVVQSPGDHAGATAMLQETSIDYRNSTMNLDDLFHKTKWTIDLVNFTCLLLRVPMAAKNWKMQNHAKSLFSVFKPLK